VPIIPALRRIRQEDHEFEGYIIRHCLKTKQVHKILLENYCDNCVIQMRREGWRITTLFSISLGQ
jgi:hypothetical protein